MPDCRSVLCTCTFPKLARGLVHPIPLLYLKQIEHAHLAAWTEFVETHTFVLDQECVPVNGTSHQYSSLVYAPATAGPDCDTLKLCPG